MQSQNKDYNIHFSTDGHSRPFISVNISGLKYVKGILDNSNIPYQIETGVEVSGITKCSVFITDSKINASDLEKHFESF